MTFAFFIAIIFTIGISALCSVLEAMVLSTTTAEIEGLKKRNSRRGESLDQYINDLEETSSAILSLNTIANTLGATLVGGLAVQLWPLDNNILLKVSLSMALAILFFSEIIPKNIGVLYRPKLQPILVIPLAWVCVIMTPISRIVGLFVRTILKSRSDVTDSDEEIMLLAEKSEKEGNLTFNERELITNALCLDEILVHEIMTPRTVVHTLDEAETIGSLFNENQNIPFARIPIYRDQSDNIVGIIRRRDILSAKANDEDQIKLAALAQDVVFIPDNATADDALQTFLKNHQQIAIAVDEYGSMSGVISMEDVIEHIIGQEIFEADDPAVDMRELARKRQFAEKRRTRN